MIVVITPYIFSFHIRLTDTKGKTAKLTSLAGTFENLLNKVKEDDNKSFSTLEERQEYLQVSFISTMLLIVR